MYKRFEIAADVFKGFKILGFGDIELYGIIYNEKRYSKHPLMRTCV